MGYSVHDEPKPTYSQVMWVFPYEDVIWSKFPLQGEGLEFLGMTNAEIVYGKEIPVVCQGPFVPGNSPKYVYRVRGKEVKG